MVLDPEEQERLAYHEAGHAVIQYILRWNILFVGIGRIAEAGQDWTGSANSTKERENDAAVVAYAGPLAEGRYRGVQVSDDELVLGKKPGVDFDDGGWEADAEVARHFAGDQLAPHIQKARALVERADVWSAISALACELCNPVRLQTTALREMPSDVRTAVLPSFKTANHDDRLAAYCYIRGDELPCIIDAMLRQPGSQSGGYPNDRNP